MNSIGDGGVRHSLWEDHRQYLASLPNVFERASSKRLIVLGNFDRQVGQNGYPPPKIRDALRMKCRFHEHRTLTDHHGVVAKLSASE